MAVDSGFHLPGSRDWRRLNGLLDELLELEPRLRENRLRELARAHPDLMPALRHLLQCSTEEHGLDELLVSALRYVARGDPEPAPERLGPWRLQRQIGFGGMARVFLAERDGQDFVQRAAVKLMRPDVSSASVRERFVQERRILASLHDARIARLLDGGETADGGIWLAMEYIQGLPVDVYCHRHRLSLAQRLRLLDEVIGAVEHAHQQLVIHRDIKPSNVLVTGDGQVRLLDFGIAKLMDDEADGMSDQTITRALTPCYASPEQRAGRPVTTASDVFQLGLLMFELITGIRPRDELPRASTVLREQLEQTGLPPREVRRRVRELRGDLDHIVARATASDPRHRYPSCERLRADLRYYRGGWPIAARADERWYRMRRFIRRHSLACGMLSVTLLAGVLYVVAAADQARAVRAEAAKATAVRDFVVDLFRQADPGHTLGRDLPVGAVLEQGRVQIEHALHEQPAIRGEMLHTLGELYRALGEYPQAEALLRESAEIAASERDREAEFRSRLTLAQALNADSRYPEAEDQARRALALAGTEREHALAEAELGYLLLKRGLPEQAEPVLRASLTRYRKLQPHSIAPMELARVRTYMAYTDLTLGRIDTAERELLAVREIYIRQVGTEHPDVQGVNYTLARVSEMRGDWTRAENSMRRVIAAETRVLGETHREVGISRTRLAHILLAQGRHEEARAEFADSLAILEATTDAPHFFLADNLKGYAELWLALGQHEPARAYLERSTRMLEQLLEWPDWRLADAYRIAAALLIEDGDCAEARRMLEAAQAPMLARPEPYPSRWHAGWTRLKAAEASGCRRPGASVPAVPWH